MGKRLGSDGEEDEEEAEEGRWGVKSWRFFSRVRELFPLVQCITNFVSMDLMANTLLAAGASPAMVHALEEVPDFTPHASALLINIGTLTPSWLASMKAAAEIANRLGKPWVLDPVAVSASEFRLRACLELLGLRPAVVRGNASEVIALSGASAGPNKVKASWLFFCTFCSDRVLNMLFLCGAFLLLVKLFIGLKHCASE